MQKLRNALLALFIAIALTWMPSFTVASAQATEFHPGLQFAIDGWEFLQFQSGDIKPGHPLHVFYDSQRLLYPANPEPCYDFETLKVTAHLISDPQPIDLVSLDCYPSTACDVVDYVKIGDFETPEWIPGELQMFFTGNDGECIDDNYGQLYTFPVY
ncbi:MAG: hypothetical protein F6K49_30830 [Moorea sp. SIO3I6]|nr:hypothetical protein [Moorena sp. SIO3I6]